MNWVTLNDIAAKTKNAIVDGPFGSNMKTSDYVEEGIPVLQGKNITNNRFRWFDIRFISKEKAQELIRSKVEVGDILLIKIGSIGYVAEIDNLNDYPFAIIPANLAKITLDKTKIDSTYFRYIFQNEKIRSKLLSLASKTAQPALSLSKIKEFKIPLTDLKTQQEIAHVLEQADKARQQRKAANALTDQFLQSSFLSLFGDPVKNEKGWEVDSVRSLASNYSDGPFGSNLKGEHYTGEGIRVIRLQNIGVNEFKNEAFAYVSNAHYEKLKKHSCYPGDVIIGTMGEPNLRACILPQYVEVAINKADCVLFRPNLNIVLPEYISYLLNIPSFVESVANLILGQTRGRISMGRLANVKLPVPPLSLQQQFAAIVAQAETLRKKQQENEQELEQLFQALLQKYFG